MDINFLKLKKSFGLKLTSKSIFLKVIILKVVWLGLALLSSGNYLFGQSNMVLTYDTQIKGQSDHNSIIIPAYGSYDVDINNDGSYEVLNQSRSVEIDVTDFGYEPGVVQVAIRNTKNGYFGFIRFANTNDAKKLVSIDQWGSSLQWKSMFMAFNGCENMVMKATDYPDVSKVFDFSGSFMNAKKFNGDISRWDVGNGIDFSKMFANALSFNQNINQWDVSEGVDFSSMFNGAVSYNQPINNWDVSSAISLKYMFLHSSAFNQNLDNWNVSRVKEFSGMFWGATAFNGNISTWDVSKGMYFANMFENAYSFNQSIENWDVSNGINFSDMFREAVSFNQSLNKWQINGSANRENMYKAASASTESNSKMLASDLQNSTF